MADNTNNSMLPWMDRFSVNKNKNGWYVNYNSDTGVQSASGWDLLSGGINWAAKMGSIYADSQAAKQRNRSLDASTASSQANLQVQANGLIKQTNQQKSLLAQQADQVNSSVAVATGESGVSGSTNQRIAAQADFSASQAAANMSENLGTSLASNKMQQIAVKNQNDANKVDTSNDWMKYLLGTAGAASSLMSLFK